MDFRRRGGRHRKAWQTDTRLEGALKRLETKFDSLQSAGLETRGARPSTPRVHFNDGRSRSPSPYSDQRANTQQPNQYNYEQYNGPARNYSNSNSQSYGQQRQQMQQPQTQNYSQNYQPQTREFGPPPQNYRHYNREQTPTFNNYESRGHGRSFRGNQGRYNSSRDPTVGAQQQPYLGAVCKGCGQLRPMHDRISCVSWG